MNHHKENICYNVTIKDNKVWEKVDMPYGTKPLPLKWIYKTKKDQLDVVSSYAGDEDTRRSTTGYMFKICGGPVSWKSQMQTSVALSSMELEYMAASAAAQEALCQLSRPRARSFLI